MAEFDIYIIKQRKKRFKISNDIYVRDWGDLGIIVQELFTRQLTKTKKNRRKRGGD